MILFCAQDDIAVLLKVNYYEGLVSLFETSTTMLSHNNQSIPQVYLPSNGASSIGHVR
jgi:hypothetical protein